MGILFGLRGGVGLVTPTLGEKACEGLVWFRVRLRLEGGEGAQLQPH